MAIESADQCYATFKALVHSTSFIVAIPIEYKDKTGNEGNKTGTSINNRLVGKENE